MISTTYELSITPGGIPLVINVSQYDANSRTLVFNLKEADGVVNLPSGVHAAVRGTKPDGNGFDNDASISGSTVTVAVTEQMTAIAGRVFCEIYLYKGTAATTEQAASSDYQQLATANFILRVERAALDKDTLVSGSTIRQLVNVIDRTDEIIAAAAQSDAAKDRIAALEAAAAADAQRAQEAYEATDERYEDIQNIKTNAEAYARSAVETAQDARTLSAQAIEKANNAENDAAEALSTIDQQQDTIDAQALALAGKVDGGYVENGVAYFTAGDQVLFEITGIGGGGGSGGGDSGNNAVMRIENTSGWISNTIAQDSPCIVSFNWSSLENEIPTGNGSLRIQVSGTTKTTVEVAQGNVNVDISGYLNAGANTVSLTVSDIYGNNRTIRVSVTLVVLTLASSFDASTPYTGAISFPYTPTGSVQKTVHFILDGTEIGTAVTSVSGRQQSYTITQQSHGAHTLRVYFETVINGQTVRSNELYFEIICLEPMNQTPIITSSFRQTTAQQFAQLNIGYTVYNPAAMTTPMRIKVNDEVVATPTVDRSAQTFSYRPNEAGTLEISVETGTVGESDYAYKEWVLTVEETDIDVEAETEGLALHLSAAGRSNSETTTREQWAYNDISATLSGFNWIINGWVQDSDGIDVLRLNDDARVAIPYQIFGSDFKSSGKTIEVEFATREVADYDATILSCVSGGIGLRITPQAVYFNGAQTNISTLYKENEHVRLTITIGKQTDYRLILIYINGVMSRAIQYAMGERFDQLTPVGITIGSNDCGIDIYTIRIYDQDLGDRAVLENWIADTQIGTLMQDRYTRNHVYSDSGDITIATLPNNLPYMVIEGIEMPQYKGDKKTVVGRYVDPVDPSKSFTFVGCQINVQGTSSAIYYRKNWDLQFKEGMTLSSGAHADNYALRSGSIPFNRFVLKADVASSESANNTGLTMYYNDLCPYKTPAMLADGRVRWGIEGIPIVLFWYNPDTGVTEFLGKHNFNLPKRAPAPYGYVDGDNTMESWEFERNNSDNVKFKDFDITAQTWDETEQAYYPTWYDDWEARFPSDEWRDTSKLGEFVRWVVSTDRAQATGDALPEAVTYTVSTIATLNGYESDDSYTVTEITQDGARTGYSVTFTKDTPAYRLTKFRAEAAQYMVLDSAVFYYIFTHQFLMIDSRAKNMFIGFNGEAITGTTGRAMDRLATFQPYDMDTALGTNNSGVLMFGYSLEDTDTVSAVISGEGGSDAPVYNAQDSVLWLNVRDAFRAEITAMYRTLRSGTLFNYAYIENWFEQHQSKWSEAIFNEDARTKYLIPLTDPVTVDDDTGQLVRTDRYLTMLQGSKTEQRKWWLYNRFRYMDSKYNTGDASKTINMRLFNGGTLTITPAIDLYVGVSFGGGTTPDLKRTTAETPVTFTYTAPSGVTEMETWIYSADLIIDVGDLSVFYPNELDFSRATRLRRLKIGSAVEGYANNNLTTINVQNSALLEHIDCRNCPRLAITVNLEGSPRLKEAFFDGTAITGVELADGATVETLHLPSTITTLTLMNLNKLTDLTLASISGVTRLMLANMDDEIIDPVTVLESIPANSQVYIEGLALECADADEIEDFLDLLDTMRGVTRERSASGEWLYHDYEKAQVSGVIHTSALTGAQIASYNARYPYITVQADHVTSYLYYYNYDGSELLHTETILDGADGVWTGTPSRTSTAQYSFTFVGWSTSQDAQAAGANARKAVVADRNVYAAYSRTVRTYTVTFAKNSADGGGTLQTVNNVPYGGSASYTGSTPTTTKGSAEDYPFEGWSPLPSNVTGNTTCYAVFGSPLEVAEITDTWAEIIANIQNGTYATKYKVGNYKELDLGAQGVVNMQIVAKDKDPLASGSGNAPLTWVSMELLSSTHRMNPDIAYNNKSAPSFTANGNTWTSQNRYTVSKAKATWTLTATSDGVITIAYKTSNANTSQNTITTLKVNDTTIVTNYANTTGGSTTVNVTTGDEVVVYCEYDHKSTSQSRYATITFSSTGTFTTAANVENADTRDTSSGVSGTGTIGGWENTEMRSYLKDTIKPLIPSEVRSAIKEVTKYTRIYNTSVAVVNNVTSTDDVWIPSGREIFGGTSYETSGPMYTTVFPDATSRIKKRAGSASSWWLRSASNTSNFYYVINFGLNVTNNANTAYGVALGFCL